MRVRRAPEGQDEMREKVLLLGEDLRSFLAAARSLGRGGLEVHAATAASPTRAPALRSRYLRAVHPLPDYDADPGAWVAALRRLLVRERFALVLPCADATILPLHRHRGELEALAPLYLLSEEAQAVIGDKRRTAELARSLGVRAPRELIARSLSDGEEALRELGLPIVLKPRESFRLGALHRKRLVRTARDRGELERLLRALLEEGEVLLQEHLPGVGVGVEALACDGEVLLAFQHVRVHEPPGGGGSSYRRSAPLDERLLDATARLLGALRYTGVAMAEFRVDARSGAFALLEINGRLWGSLPLAVAAGADFPLHLYEMLARGRRDFPRRYRVGLYGRNLSGDLSYLWQSLRGRDAAALLQVPLELRHLLLGRERLDTLTLDDPAPALGELAALLGQARGAAAVRAASLLSRRQRGEEGLRSARSLLFVCKGNICRSPFAAARAAALLPGVRVGSAGYAAVPGRRSPAAALGAAAATGVDLSAHRAQALDEALLGEADLVFVFDEDCWRSLWTRHPSARPRLRRLADLAGAPSIADPDGGAEAEFVACYALIERALRRAAELRAPGADSPAAAPRAARAAAPSCAPPPPAAPP